MKSKKMTFILIGLLISVFTLNVSGQMGAREQKAPDDITKWTNKTIMWVGPHQDDESGCLGTLSLLKANGNLYFPQHRINEGLQPFTVTDYLFYATGDTNYDVDITSVSDKRISARAWYVSQFGAGNFKYAGPEPDQESLKNQLSRNAERIANGEKIYERFRRLSESMSF